MAGLYPQAGIREGPVGVQCALTINCSVPTGAALYKNRYDGTKISLAPIPFGGEQLLNIPSGGFLFSTENAGPSNAYQPIVHSNLAFFLAEKRSDFWMIDRDFFGQAKVMGLARAHVDYGSDSVPRDGVTSVMFGKISTRNTGANKIRARKWVMLRVPRHLAQNAILPNSTTSLMSPDAIAAAKKNNPNDMLEMFEFDPVGFSVDDLKGILNPEDVFKHTHNKRSFQAILSAAMRFAVVRHEVEKLKPGSTPTKADIDAILKQSATYMKESSDALTTSGSQVMEDKDIVDFIFGPLMKMTAGKRMTEQTVASTSSFIDKTAKMMVDTYISNPTTASQIDIGSNLMTCMLPIAASMISPFAQRCIGESLTEALGGAQIDIIARPCLSEFSQKLSY